MTAMTFDPLAIYFIIALIAVPVVGLIYTAITEHWYWKGWKDGKRFTANENRSVTYPRNSR